MSFFIIGAIRFELALYVPLPGAVMGVQAGYLGPPRANSRVPLLICVIR